MPAQKKKELKKLRRNQLLVEDRDLLKTDNPISVTKEKKGKEWLYTFTLNSEKDAKHRWSPKVVINNKKIFNFKVSGENYTKALQMYRTEVWRRHSDVMASKKLSKYDTGPAWVAQRKEHRERVKNFKKVYSTKNHRPLFQYT